MPIPHEQISLAIIFDNALSNVVHNIAHNFVGIVQFFFDSSTFNKVSNLRTNICECSL